MHEEPNCSTSLLQYRPVFAPKALSRR
jgi:hypothetical protein